MKAGENRSLLASHQPGHDGIQINELSNVAALGSRRRGADLRPVQVSGGSDTLKRGRTTNFRGPVLTAAGRSLGKWLQTFQALKTADLRSPSKVRMHSSAAAFQGQVPTGRCSAAGGARPFQTSNPLASSHVRLFPESAVTLPASTWMRSASVAVRAASTRWRKPRGRPRHQHVDVW